MQNQLKSIFFLTAIVGFISLAAMSPILQKDDHRAKNLKILPKDINNDDLKALTDNFKTALGVKCDFCHAKSKEDPKKLDFASDEKEYKHVARDMMRMTNTINKKYFKHHEGNESVAVIQCMTCHHGNKKPQLALSP
ncbi:c-type cytochrome [Pedobacter arcticus]|uniref:c-type cytochrome n=1 Tax=Pedobacter arcticus TaxID=752140 RepID=UPI000318F6B7|nr:c-type cytochrome [Pedobacter arcticus]